MDAVAGAGTASGHPTLQIGGVATLEERVASCAPPTATPTLSSPDPGTGAPKPARAAPPSAPCSTPSRRRSGLSDVSLDGLAGSARLRPDEPRHLDCGSGCARDPATTTGSYDSKTQVFW